MLEILDRQMESWSELIRMQLQAPLHDPKKIASTIYSELVKSSDRLQKITTKQETGPGFQDLIDELVAFQSWMDFSSRFNEPGVVRARVITEVYICFVYLSDAIFYDLRRLMPADTLTHVCASALVTDKVRKFRHAIAHANWKYAPDFGALICWAWNDAKQLEEFRVSQAELDFWQALSRCVAYTFVSAMK